MNYPGTLASDWPGGFWWHFLAFALIILGFIILMVMGFIWYERRGVGRFQIRLGPNRVGPWGLLQPVADVIKIMTKEDLIPSGADKIVFWLAPLVSFVPVLMVFAVVPFRDGALLADLNVGLLYIIAMSAISTVGIFMAGWAANNKYALLGAMRAVALLISYEIPMGLALVAVVLTSGSLSTTDIVAAQDIPFLIVQPVGFLVFFIAALAEINRTPFDLIEADSELVAGYNIEYSSTKFATMYLTEYGEALMMSTLVTTFFLGGWRGPLLPPVLWFLIKIMAVFSLIMWIRSTLPRFRIDQAMGFTWKFLLPLGLGNLLFIGARSVFFPQLAVWMIFLVELVIGVVALILMGRFLTREKLIGV